jgi:Cadherin-like domain/Bacterial Ig domain/Matrixin
MNHRGWWRRAMTGFRAGMGHARRRRTRYLPLLQQLEERCVLTEGPWPATVPAAQWPVAEMVAGQLGDLWFRPVVGQTLGHASSQGVIQQWTPGLPVGSAQDLETDPFGNLWFLVNAPAPGPYLVRLTQAGSFLSFSDFGPVLAKVSDLATPPAGFLPNILFNGSGAGELVGVNADGTHSFFALPTGASPGAVQALGGPVPVVRGPDGAFWYPDGDGIVRLSADGAFQRFPLPNGNHDTVSTIAVGADGNLWFVENRAGGFGGFADAIGPITTDGDVTEFSLAGQGSRLAVSNFVAGSDGSIWFDLQGFQADGITFQAGSHRIGRIGPGNSITEYVPPNDDAVYKVVAVGHDGTLWKTTPFNVDLSAGYSLYNLLPSGVQEADPNTPPQGLQSSVIDKVSLGDMPLDNSRTITVPPAPPRAVRAVPDSYDVVSGFSLSMAAPGVLGNDRRGTGSTLTAVLVSGPAHGSLTLNANGSLTYTPSAGFAGTDTFSYQANDGVANSPVTTVTVNVRNQAPVAGADWYAVLPGGALHVAAAGVLGNDHDADGQPLSVGLVGGPTHGTLTFNADGSFDYVPDSDFVGTDAFTYAVSDGVTSSNTATVTVEVTTLPVAHDDGYATGHGQTAVITGLGVLANDTAPLGAPLTPTLVSGTSHGSLTWNGDGSFSYTPADGFAGTDSFTYQVNDGTADSNVATVTLTVTDTAPAAADASYRVDEDQTLTVAAPGLLGGASDADGDGLSVHLVSGPAHGTLTFNGDNSFTYTPDTNFHGSDSFTYLVSDGTADSEPATVTLTVNPVDDAPVAQDVSVSTPQGTALTVTVSLSDVDDDALQTILAATPHHGSVTMTTGQGGTLLFTYTPRANYNGGDSFTYVVYDGQGGTASGTVTITVGNGTTPPTAANDDFVGQAGQPLTGSAPGVLANDTAVDGATLTAVLVTGPAHGTLTLRINGSFTYTPAAGFVGTDSFTYKANDANADSNAATVTITIAGGGEALQASQVVARAGADPLSPSLLEPLVREALARWAGSGTAAVTVAVLQQVQVRIAELPGALLGLTEGTSIWIDRDAAGQGWFVDATPWDDVEFTPTASGLEMRASGASPAAGRIDLLTVLTHEIGHALGLEHEAEGVMEPTLESGLRRLIADRDRRQLPPTLPAALVAGPLAPTVAVQAAAGSLLAPEELFPPGILAARAGRVTGGVAYPVELLPRDVQPAPRFSPLPDQHPAPSGDAPLVDGQRRGAITGAHEQDLLGGGTAESGSRETRPEDGVLDAPRWEIDVEDFWTGR